MLTVSNEEIVYVFSADEETTRTNYLECTGPHIEFVQFSIAHEEITWIVPRCSVDDDITRILMKDFMQLSWLGFLQDPEQDWSMSKSGFSGRSMLSAER